MQEQNEILFVLNVYLFYYLSAIDKTLPKAALHDEYIHFPDCFMQNHRIAAETAHLLRYPEKDVPSVLIIF